MAALKDFIKKALPSSVRETLFSIYHFLLAALAAFLYRAPSRELLVVGVTGTKGKSSVTEMVNAILEAAGHKTALMNSIRFKVDDSSRPNLTRMSMPGRFFVQRFLRKSVDAGCTAAVLEMTSEGARQHRHRFVHLDALVFTNLAPEHIESHGSFEKYADAKYELGKQLARSKKRPRVIVSNGDDKEGGRYLLLPVEFSIPFSLSSAAPWNATDSGGSFTFEGREISIPLPGEFSLKNALAAASAARALGVDLEIIGKALSSITKIPGRAEKLECGQDFTVVVDYAHTPDSLAALYDAFKEHRRVCVLGAAGGGRDAWKRPVMGRIAQASCAEVILTNEDPYDEDPQQIASDIAHGMTKKPRIIMERRVAIREALMLAKPGDAVLITGKGTDPAIAGPKGTKTPWSDAAVAREEIEKMMQRPAV